MHKFLTSLVVTTSLFIALSPSIAAERHELRNDHQLLKQLQHSNSGTVSGAAIGLSENESLQLISSKIDRQGNSHNRYRQTIGGVPVWGEQVIISRDPVGNITRLHGRLIKGLDRELVNLKPAMKPAQALTRMQQKTQRAVSANAALNFENESVELVIYLKEKTPVLSYAVSFFADTATGGQPTRPTYLIDASNGQILFEYEGLTHAKVGIGPGGNDKTLEYHYGTDFDSLDVAQLGDNCSMINGNVKTVDLNHGSSGSTAFSFICFFNNHKTINGAFSPLNDAHFFGGVVFDMYDQWLQVSPLSPELMPLTMRVHYGSNYENAFWDGSSMTFGDGDTIFYPLVSLDVTAHEVSHGFTEQHSDLIYSGQSGGINVAFSDMAGEAAESYMRGSNDFLVGEEIFKEANKALRYMENPTWDGISIDDASDYYAGMNVHYSSGVYNKAFYLLATNSNWSTQTAFQLFAYANQYLWTPNTNFVSGAWAVLDAVDYVDDLPDGAASHVTAAFASVGINLGPLCENISVLPSGESTRLSGSEGSWRCFSTEVADGTTQLSISSTEPRIKGKNKPSPGDMDIYVNFDRLPYVTAPALGSASDYDDFDCSSLTPDSIESCVFTPPELTPGTWFTAVYGWSAYTNITLSATTEGTEPPSAGTPHLGSLSGEMSQPQKWWRGSIDVVVHTANHAPLSGSVVTGVWSNGTNASGQCTTGSDGYCQITKSSIKNNTATFTLTGLDGQPIQHPHNIDLSVELTMPAATAQ